MRSSKSRSRSKSNRSRSSGGGSVLNRVFDSSGPEGKVRGTPQQVIDKYNQLARDAHLGNDRVAAENFQQHAEHYLRVLGEAQREQDSRREEQDARREEQERQNRERQAERDRERAERSERQERESNSPAPEPTHTSNNQDPGAAPQPDVLDLGDASTAKDSGLVETPEGAPKKPSRRTRKPAAKAPVDAPADSPTEQSARTTPEDGSTPEAAE
jgi:hypothetical protein